MPSAGYLTVIQTGRSIMANFIINTIKNVVNNKVSEIKTAFRQGKNIIQAAVSAQTLGLTTDQVVAVALDEAKKYTSITSSGVEFRIVLNDDDEFVNRIKTWRESAEQHLHRKFKILSQFQTGRKFLDDQARQAAFNAALQICGETLTQEKDGKDSVYIYADVLCCIWFLLARNGESWDEVVRQIVRHEFRHMRQFLRLRERGGNGYVLLAYDVDVANPDYLNRITEKDAWGNQSREPKDQDALEPVVDQIIEKFPKAFRSVA